MLNAAIDILKKLPLDDLLDMLTKSTKELTDMIHIGNKKEVETKTKEVQLLQKSIAAKRAEVQPGSPL